MPAGPDAGRCSARRQARRCGQQICRDCRRRHFRDDELDLPYYLAHFHRIANSVALTGTAPRLHRHSGLARPEGQSAVQRQDHGEHPVVGVLLYARIVRGIRIAATRRCARGSRRRSTSGRSSQNADGRFSEYAVGQWSLAPTAFATKFMGESLRLLRDGPPIDSAIHRRAIDADRKALMAVLTLPDMQEHGSASTNQFSNAFAGALAYLDLYPDAELVGEAARAGLTPSASDHQSPVGFFYEATVRIGATTSTRTTATSSWRGTTRTARRLGRRSASRSRRWYEWFAYNAVPEPTAIGALTLNRAIETRQRRATVAEAGAGESGGGNPIAEVIPSARVLGPTREELVKRIAAASRGSREAGPASIRSRSAHSARSRRTCFCIGPSPSGTPRRANADKLSRRCGINASRASSISAPTRASRSCSRTCDGHRTMLRSRAGKCSPHSSGTVSGCCGSQGSALCCNHKPPGRLRPGERGSRTRASFTRRPDSTRPIACGTSKCRRPR